jgi:hypothetical protein
VTVAGDDPALALRGLDVAGRFELLEGGADDLARALGLAARADLVAVRTLFCAAVLGAEAADADRPVDGDFPQEAGGPADPEVLLYGRELPVDAGLGELQPLGFFDGRFLGEFRCDRLDEFFGGRVVERRH